MAEATATFEAFALNVAEYLHKSLLDGRAITGIEIAVPVKTK
jgi:hypothetical protein